MSKTYHAQTARFIAAIAEAVPPDVPADVMQGWIERPKALRKALNETLCPSHETNFPTWKTVTVGNLGNAETARNQLEVAGIKMDHCSDYMLERVVFESTEVTLDLVQVSVRELGLKDGASTTEIYAAAESHGLSLCPAEVAPQLWLQYPDLLLRGEWVRAAMEAVSHRDGNHGVFDLGHDDDGRWLLTDEVRSDDRWDGRSCRIFVRSK